MQFINVRIILYVLVIIIMSMTAYDTGYKNGYRDSVYLHEYDCTYDEYMIYQDC